MVKRVGKYEIGKTLGEGTFGKVKIALNVETNEKVGRLWGHLYVSRGSYTNP